MARGADVPGRHRMSASTLTSHTRSPGPRLCGVMGRRCLERGDIRRPALLPSLFILVASIRGLARGKSRSTSWRYLKNVMGNARARLKLLPEKLLLIREHLNANQTAMQEMLDYQIPFAFQSTRTEYGSRICWSRSRIAA